MIWTKCTPKTMPNDFESVMVTVESSGGERYVEKEARYNPSFGTWEWPYEAGADYWEDIEGRVTHWMRYPEPAKD